MTEAGSLLLADEAATEAFGAALAQASGCRGLVTLSGDLGSGKTTLSRGLIRAAGHRGAVKSPTFTLVEPYEFADGRRILHFDLYRLEDPEELEFLGIRDYLDGAALCLVEWPERGVPLLPPADLALRLEHLKRGRRIRWTAGTGRGSEMSRALGLRFSGGK